MLFQGIDTIILRVKDYQKSRLWFEEKLGLKSVYENEEIQLAVLDTGSPTSLTLWQTDQPILNNPKTSSYPIFKTESAEYSRSELIKNGVKTTELICDSFVTYFQFFDTDGNVLEACQVHE